MYSLVLAAALTAGASSADFHGCFSCFNKNSCAGSCYGCGGCYGSSCAGACYGSCAGSYRHGSSCYGNGWSGCYGWSCSGACSGCSGACYGSACYGSSCYGAACAGSGYSYSGHGCYGCYGCYGCAGSTVSSSYGTTGAYAGEATYVTAAKPRGAAEAARLVVSLPADAKLYVDGAATKTADKATRVFRTPELAQGEQYVYTLKAEVVRDGKMVTESKQVVVTAGAEAAATFTFAEESKVAAK